ncbi:uncharacterized protein [Antedon mediterranea]|uniref:uncharacterized protein isoform X2 n=1 Tax=Antedon mediterranea TaxID=105859 RepID=UPI003AF8B211
MQDKLNRTFSRLRKEKQLVYLDKELLEEHAAWINKVLKRHKLRPVSDLRKAVSESLTLVNLVEILTNEKLPGIQTKPIIRAQKAENIRQCLNLLRKKRTDIEGLEAEDIADGSLNAVLDLVSQIRKRFDKSATNGSIHTTESYSQHASELSRPSSGKSMIPPDAISTQSFNSLNSLKRPESIATYRSNESYEMRGNQSCPVTMNIVSEPVLPGSMTPRGQEENKPIVMQRIDNLMSTTQLDSRGVSQQGVHVRRDQLTLEKSNRYAVRPEPRKKPVSAWSNARNFSKSRLQVREELSMTVEDRLKNLLDSPAPGGSIHYQENFDDGELIQPPPPQARYNYGYVDDEDENNNMDDENKINDMLDNPNKFKAPTDWDRYVSGYIPSHAEEKLEGPRAQALLDRPKISPREETPTQRPDPTFKSPPTQHMGQNRHENNLPGYFSSNNEQERLNSAYPIYSEPNQGQYPSWYKPHQNTTSHYQTSQNLNPQYTTKDGHFQKYLPSYQEHINRQTPDITRQTGQMRINNWWKEYEGHPQQYNGERDGRDYNLETDQYKESEMAQEKKRKLPYVNQVNNQSEFDDSKMAKLRERNPMQERISFYDDLNSRNHISGLPTDEFPTPQYNSTPYMQPPPQHEFQPRHDNLFGNKYYYDDSPDFDLNYEPSDCSSRSHTPTLPLLSPGNTPPSSVGSSPILGRCRRSLSIGGLPESMQERLLKLAYSGNTKETNSSREVVKTPLELEKTKKKTSRKPSFLSFSQRKLIKKRVEADENHEDPEDSASESVMDTRRNASELEQKEVETSPLNADTVRAQLLQLETMYKDIIQLIGTEKQSEKSSKKNFLKRRNLSKPSTPRGITKSKSGGSRPSKQRERDLKTVNKRFSRVESHVVTLARSVAHLSSELRTQSSVLREVELLRHEVNQLRDMQMMNVNELLSSPKFRPILPQCANPQRIKKLTKFFGEEPPLLAMFLKELGYQKYAANFEKEGIGMIELPYLSEERLESIGVPIGPRLRILQEAQLIV